jgi:hypothetical protein
MRPIDDPFSLTPDERFSEIAAILAGGVLRLHARSALSAVNLGLERSLDSGPAGLEVSEETPPCSVSIAVNLPQIHEIRRNTWT